MLVWGKFHCAVWGGRVHARRSGSMQSHPSPRSSASPRKKRRCQVLNFATRMEITCSMKTPTVRPHCYICSSTVNLTKDHLPPKGFFPVNQRKNLLSADCCEDCHRRLSMDDEATRLWLSSAASASPAGKWIWHNEAFPSLQRKPKFHENVRKFVSTLKTNTPR